ncbi:MAG TPA: type IV toxin-antitoxin system AbiEi family antitoxin [Kineosporiaceae bacterium]|nr:type IV toxin-antitoxin system AbiEi family antitoxin [Kineosporiaceae bacterium]
MPLALPIQLHGTELLLDGQPFDRPIARREGLRDPDVTALVAAGAVRQVVRGVYLDARVPDDLASRAACLRLRLPDDAVVGRLTAAWLFGVDGRMPDQLREAPVVECIVPPGRQPLRRPGVRCYVAPPADEVIVVDGIPTTTPTRTAVDCLRWLLPHMGLGVADGLAAAGLLCVPDLVSRVSEAAGLRGAVQARRLAPLVEPRTESMGESWLRLRVVDAGFPRPRVQIEVCDEDGRCMYRLDLGWDDERVALEYDGEEHHSSAAQLGHDRRRREVLETTYGWRVLAVGKGEVLGRSLALERAIGELLSREPRILRRSW